VDTWQREWDTTNKGKITKDYFPKIAERLRAKIYTTQIFIQQEAAIKTQLS
jgi:hypothetical protein